MDGYNIKNGMIDIHAHILPGIDDGARDIEESCYLLRRAVKEGITAVIVTPHDNGRVGPEELRELLARVEQEFCRDYPGFCFFLGQELFYRESLADRLAAGKVLTMAGSQYVLVEFHTGASYGEIYRGIRTLFSAGYLPILAHVERYICLRKKENMEELIGSGCLLQMNFDSLCGSAWNASVRWCRKQVLAGRIHFLGTDMHRKEVREPELRNVSKWLKEHAGTKMFEMMTRENPLRIIEGEGIH